MEITSEVVEKIAKACHMANKSYCHAIGDDSQPAWDEAPEFIKESARIGVLHHIMNPGVTPAESHQVWLDHKVKEGWVYGTEKDLIKKTHPCICDYAQLPREQKAKDYLFQATVNNCKEILGLV